MRTNSEYETIECINIPKVLFTNKKYEGLSCDAKLLYGLLLERRSFSEINEWIDNKGVPYVIYPKTEMMKHLNATKYRVNLALAELNACGDMAVVTLPVPGNPCQIYVKDITADLETVEKGTENTHQEEKVKDEDGCVQSGEDWCKASRFQRFLYLLGIKKRFKNLIEDLNTYDDEEDPEIADLVDDELFEVDEDMLEEMVAGDDDIDEDDDCDDISSDPISIMAMEDRGFLVDGEIYEEMIQIAAYQFGLDLAFAIRPGLKTNNVNFEKMIIYLNALMFNENYDRVKAILRALIILFDVDTRYLLDMECCIHEAKKIYLTAAVGKINSICNDTMIFSIS